MDWKNPAYQWKPQSKLKNWINPKKDFEILDLQPCVQLYRPIGIQDYFDAAQDRNRQAYQEATRIILIDNHNPPHEQKGGPNTIQVIDGHCYEFARFRSSGGQSGFIKGISTLINYKTDPYGTQWQPNLWMVNDTGSVFYPYVPNWIWSGYSENNPIIIRYRWHLRLDFRQNLDVTWDHLTTSNDLPGQPFRDMPYWDDQRYLWGQFNPIFWMTPKNSYLRLYFEAIENCGAIGEDNQYLWVIGARLWGYNLPCKSEQAYEMAYKGWI